MKTIVYRGGVVTFRIPSNWLEDYSDMDGGEFYEDDPNAGTLRLKIITVESPGRLGSDAAKELLSIVRFGLEQQGVVGTVSQRQDGNVLFQYVESTRERGTPLKIFYWIVANPLLPHHGRIATFSFTILASRQEEPSTRSDLEMLEAEIEAASFASELRTTS